MMVVLLLSCLALGICLATLIHALAAYKRDLSELAWYVRTLSKMHLDRQLRMIGHLEDDEPILLTPAPEDSNDETPLADR